MLELGGVLLPNWVRFGESLVPQLMGGGGAADRFVYVIRAGLRQGCVGSSVLLRSN